MAGRRSARRALAVAVLYIAAMFLERCGRGARSRPGWPGPAAARRVFMVTPVIANPLRREVLVDLGDRYEKGFVEFAPAPHFRPAGYGVETHDDDPLAREAMPSRVGWQFLQWARFPFYVIERTQSPPRVLLNDARYSGPMGSDGWSATLVPVPEVPTRLVAPPR